MNLRLALFVAIACFSLFFLWHVHTRVQYNERESDSEAFTQRSAPLRRSFKVYVYNWSADIVHRWPKAYTHRRLATERKFSTNNGAGPVVNLSQGLYHTHQYALFSLFYHRLLRSPYHTSDPEAATAFFVPYDVGMDASVRESDGALIATHCPQRGRVHELLSSSPFFRRNEGRDHFAIHSINHMMLFFLDAHCREFYTLCEHCVKYSIDLYNASLYSVLRKWPEMTNNWFSIPFPSNYHYHTLSTTHPPWQIPFRSLSDIEGIERFLAQKRFAISFVGSAQVTAKAQRALRLQIMNTCRKFPQECVLNELDSHTSNVNVSPAETHAQSIFCFSPGGDFPSRKGFLDAMLSPCIPVTFQLESAQLQWSYHWGSVETALRCSVYIPRDEFMDNPQRAFAHLIALSRNKTFVADKFLAIASIAHRFQYSLADEIENIDAFEVTMQHLQTLLKV